ncbi:MAG: riboflavin biosynthesis protein RibF [Clostridia bacterium]|nr:riboflavin biosynthesis protein RibF [Clostridia bacterium]
MQIYDLTTPEPERVDSTAAIRALKKNGAAIALGNFDGVHAGHTAIITTAVAHAIDHGLIPAVFSFEPHPSFFFGSPAPQITPLADKLAIMETLGVKYAILGDFAALRDFTPERFVEDILIDTLGCTASFCGFNYTFGKEGKGNARTLTTLMEAHNRTAAVLPRIDIDGIPVSSTILRQYIEIGDMETTARLLGRHYFLNSHVRSGKRLGRTIGVPTINQYFEGSAVVPAKGVYACRCRIDGKAYIAVTNIGSRPTVNADTEDITCESHLIGYSGDLYNRSVKVRFYKRLRGEIRFDSLASLKAQIKRDEQAAIAYFDSIR